MSSIRGGFVRGVPNYFSFERYKQIHVPNAPMISIHTLRLVVNALNVNVSPAPPPKPRLVEDGDI